MLAPGLAAALDAASPGRVRRNASLSRIGRWRIGGDAAILVEPDTAASAVATLRVLADLGAPWVVIGDGANILFDSAGYHGVVVRIGPALGRIDIDSVGGCVRAEAGVWTPRFVRAAIASGLAGCVHAIGIPGGLGGLIAMNGGSRRQGIGDSLMDVDAVGDDGALRRIDRAACGFGYRSSIFLGGGLVILSARFRFEPGDPGALRREALEILADRRRRLPREFPNCGSVFVSNPALYATLGPPGRAIEAVGLKGARIGGARVSPRHANVIENLGGATSEDVLRLIALMRRRVALETGVAMSSEVRHLPPEGPLRPAHLSALALEGEVAPG